jgi:DegV family protein with EDD domain
VRVVTDSTSDVPQAVVDELDICVVPAYVQVGGRSYRDRVDLRREDFYEQLPAMREIPTTAAPPIDDFVHAYRSCADATDEIVAVLVSEKLSGICNAARVASDQARDRSVTVIDSGQVSMGLGWQAIAAAEAAAAGTGLRGVLDVIAGVQARIRLFAVLDTMDYLHRSGRVSWAAAEAARLLRIKPILGVRDGVVASVGRSRTRSRALAKLASLLQESAPIARLAVLHTAVPEIGAFCDFLSDLVGIGVAHRVLVTTAIGTHVGPGAVGIAAVAAA